ncbi:helix-turn-helix transcriptional regulator [Curvibacter sp. CHRR-16]|uniref:AraC family transcriptional regulator n=1 Tax=Curvibacter sp. CHRR-16 TaxID=2835872 RepID=UPI001BD967E7|nr:AraC family transcriptional regulator [Curvibacter sp. CHRR-16]MBT0568822.1 helix-turn-helix transcriptional regulator [Curvibacter sp. CHRR-16]
MPTGQHAFFRYPHCPHLELRVSTAVSDCYQLHSHAEFSFGLIDGGSAVCQVRGMHTALQPGMSIMIEPHVPHACNPIPGSAWAYRMLYVQSDWLAQQMAAPTVDELLFSQHCIHDRRSFQRLHRIMQRMSSAALALQTDEELLQWAAEHMHPTAPAPQPVPAALRQARDWIHAHATEAIRLQDLSQHCGLSGYQLIRQFKHTYGLPPHAYQLDLRIQTAQQLLKSGMELSQVALDLGFADQAHFQRHFRKRSATTPATYAAHSAA